jgi:aryl-alcohol dehydrogenase-like predicted oxidoreductase
MFKVRRTRGHPAMKYVRLGTTRLKVSRLGLGCMSYGDPTTPGAHEWSLREDEAQPFFRQAIDLGITFWDTANVYQAGTSEEVVGRAIRQRREDIVLATKLHGKMHDGPRRQMVHLPSRRASCQCGPADRQSRQVTMAQVALAWVLTNPIVSAPIVGATKPHHLTEAVAALDLQLTDDEIRTLEEPYTAHGRSWFVRGQST